MNHGSEMRQFVIQGLSNMINVYDTWEESSLSLMYHTISHKQTQINTVTTSSERPMPLHPIALFPPWPACIRNLLFGDIVHDMLIFENGNTQIDHHFSASSSASSDSPDDGFTVSSTSSPLLPLTQQHMQAKNKPASVLGSWCSWSYYIVLTALMGQR